MFQTFAGFTPTGSGAGAKLAPPPRSPQIMIEVAEVAATLLRRRQDEHPGPQTWATTEEAQTEVAALLQRAADEGSLRLFDVRPNGQLVALPHDYLCATRRWSGEPLGAQLPAVRSWLEGRRVASDFVEDVRGAPLVFVSQDDVDRLLGGQGPECATAPEGLAWMPRLDDLAKVWVTRPEVQAEGRRRIAAGETGKTTLSGVMFEMCEERWSIAHLRQVCAEMGVRVKG